jgi:hypothetical protein
MTMPLYEVAILEQPTKNEKEDGASEKLVFGPRAVVARDEQAAAVSAVLDQRDADDHHIEVDRSRMTILVRPFV